MSHIKLCIELLKKTEGVYCILEDDVEFTPEFIPKLSHLLEQLENVKWDIVYLGHHLYKEYVTKDSYNKTKLPIIEKWSRYRSLKESIGGTGGYLISRKGAERLLNFINRTGMTNGIDTVQQKTADELDVYYATPHLIYSECWRGDNNPDTDIQYNYESLTVALNKRVVEEIEYYKGIPIIDNTKKALSNITNNNLDTPFLYTKYSDNNDGELQPPKEKDVYEVQKQSVHPCYNLDNKFLFVVPGGNADKYFHRFKKNDEWDVEDALQYDV
jgi:GR25 family glycosyltransferase involved in LPS biosynthesis